MSSSDLIKEPTLQYTIISIGSVFTICCCISIFKKYYTRRRNNYVQHQHNNTSKIENSHNPGELDNEKIEIVSDKNDEKKNEYSTNNSPYNHIRDAYINELIQEYISTVETELTEYEIRNKYNHFRTSEDILNFKNKIK